MAHDFDAGVAAEQRAGSGGGEVDFLAPDGAAAVEGEGGAFEGWPLEDVEDACLGGIGGGKVGGDDKPSMTSHDGSADSERGAAESPISSMLATDHLFPTGASHPEAEESEEDLPYDLEGEFGPLS